MIFPTPDIGREERLVLDLIRNLWRELRFNLQNRPRKWTGLLARTLRARAIQGSNSIEGYVVSREDALAAVDGDIPLEADDISWTNVLHYREAMDYVLRLSDAPDFSFSKDLLRSLHFIMIRHDIRANPGTWRQGEIFVRNLASGETLYSGPPSENITSLIQELVDELNKEKKDTSLLLIQAAIAHLNLVMIHPFSDGNGRMARCLQTLVLARGGVLDPTFSSIEEYLGRNTQAYYDVLARVGKGKWNPKRDTKPWVRFCLTAHYRQAKSAERRLNTVSAIGEEIEEELKKKGLPERAAPSLVNAALGDRLRNVAYRHDADVSMLVASRDLKALVDAGMLTFVGDKRGRYYLASPNLKKLAEKHRDRSPIPDPFQLR
jgi:Fic family protein